MTTGGRLIGTFREGQRRPRRLKSLADKIVEGGVNTCCLLEANLYTAEHEPGHKWVRKCRVCGSRHYRMRAEPIPLLTILRAPNQTHRRSSGARNLRMTAQRGGFGAR